MRHASEQVDSHRLDINLAAAIEAALKRSQAVQFDGPPMAYFELADDVHFDTPVRVTHRTVRLAGSASDSDGLLQEFSRRLQSVIDALQHTGDHQRFVIWRVRPHYVVDKGMGEWRCRVAVSPPIHPAVWLMVEVAEGAPTPVWQPWRP